MINVFSNVLRNELTRSGGETMYRPEGWRNPELEFEKRIAEWARNGIVASCAFSTPSDAFEAGADALLGELRKGVDRPYPNMGYPFRATVALKEGIVVFIPDDSPGEE